MQARGSAARGSRGHLRRVGRPGIPQPGRQASQDSHLEAKHAPRPERTTAHPDAGRQRCARTRTPLGANPFATADPLCSPAPRPKRRGVITGGRLGSCTPAAPVAWCPRARCTAALGRLGQVADSQVGGLGFLAFPLGTRPRRFAPTRITMDTDQFFTLTSPDGRTVQISLSKREGSNWHYAACDTHTGQTCTGTASSREEAIKNATSLTQT